MHFNFKKQLFCCCILYIYLHQTGDDFSNFKLGDPDVLASTLDALYDVPSGQCFGLLHVDALAFVRVLPRWDQADFVKVCPQAQCLVQRKPANVYRQKIPIAITPSRFFIDFLGSLVTLEGQVDTSLTVNKSKEIGSAMLHQS